MGMLDVGEMALDEGATLVGKARDARGDDRDLRRAAGEIGVAADGDEALALGVHAEALVDALEVAGEVRAGKVVAERGEYLVGHAFVFENALSRAHIRAAARDHAVERHGVEHLFRDEPVRAPGVEDDLVSARLRTENGVEILGDDLAAVGQRAVHIEESRPGHGGCSFTVDVTS